MTLKNSVVLETEDFCYWYGRNRRTSLVVIECITVIR